MSALVMPTELRRIVHPRPIRLGSRSIRLSTETQIAIVAGVAVASVGGYIWWRRRQKLMSKTDDNDESGTPDSSDEMRPAAAGMYNQQQYKPLAPETIDLFRSAARAAELPIEWADMPELHNILQKESQGWVGIPNYHFGNFWGGQRREEWPLIWASIRDGTWRKHLAEPFQSYVNKTKNLPTTDWLPSSATGLGQLTSTNIKTGDFYPTGLQGIGNALEEAIGFLRYIKKKYGDPQTAWEKYGKGHEGY